MTLRITKRVVARGAGIALALGIAGSALECTGARSPLGPEGSDVTTSEALSAAICAPVSRLVPPGLPSSSPQYVSYSCGCPYLKNPRTGAIARLFAGGDSQQQSDALLLEDAVTGDSYTWKGLGAAPPSWVRAGSSARTYAFGAAGGVTSLYRISGDGREEVQSLAGGGPGDQWDRIGKGVATGLFTSGAGVFTPGYTLSGGNHTSALTLWQLASPSTLVWREIDGEVNSGQATAYAGSDSGIYKFGSVGTSAFGIYQYLAPSWSMIGAGTIGTLYPAGGTVFVVSGSTVTRYLGAPFTWRAVSPGGAVTKIAGTTTSAFALIQGNVAELNLATNQWSTVRVGNDTTDIVAGAAHLFAMTAAGKVLMLSGGAWSDITCAGEASKAGCANQCDPAPAITGVAPAYSDSFQQAQVSPNSTPYDVLTQHNDIARTGAVTHEDRLTPASVAAAGSFGLLASVAVSGKIYAQPLYVENAAVRCGTDPTKNANIAYVATLENMVYAIDVDHPSVCWSTPLGCPQRAWANECGLAGKDSSCNQNFDIAGQGKVNVGIVSTPVIDVAHSVMYVVTRVRDGSDQRGRFFVNTIDTRTGQPVARVEAIADGLNGRIDCGTDAFRPSLSTNRAGLLLTNNRLFLAFSENAGEDPLFDYHGNVMAFDVSSPAKPIEMTTSFCATPTSTGGGIWMAGGGLASDGVSAYFTTGNGTYAHRGNGGSGDISKPDAIPEAPSGGNFPASFVKLSTSDLSPTGYTDTRVSGQDGLSTRYQLTDGAGAHSIFWARERADADYGSGGVLVLGNRVIGGGKDGILYVLDAQTMTRVQAFQAFVDLGNSGLTYNFQTQYYAGPHIHGGPVVWDASSFGNPDAYVYAWSEKDHLKMFRFNKGLGKFEANDAVDATGENPFPTAHSDIGSRDISMPGGMLSVSSNGAQNGIVWATVEEPFKECHVAKPNDPNAPAPHCNVNSGYVSGRLYAFDARPDSQNRLRILWGDTSVASPNNVIPRYAKFTPPTIAHGKVLVATADDKLLIYGATGRPAPPVRFPGLAAAWANGTPSGAATSVAVYPSSGTGFPGWGQWVTTPGWDSTSQWIAGDFNGDGLTDIATVWNNANVATVALRQSTGSSFMLSTWIENAGKWDPSTHWLGADFDGDGVTDLAAVRNEAGNTSVAVWGTTTLNASNLPSSGTSWIATPGWDSTSQWLAGDFDGDGKGDLATVWNNGGTNTIAMRQSTGFSFLLGTWLVSAGGWMPSTQWLAGDFDGNGLTDLAAVWASGTSLAVTTSVAVYPSSGTAFPGWTQWITTPGWDATSQWVAGDFNSDGKTDIATIWNSGVNTIAMRQSTGSTFTLGTWATNAGGWAPSTHWLAGKFTP